MAKYNFELKKKIVLEHLSLGVGSKERTGKRSGIGKKRLCGSCEGTGETD